MASSRANVSGWLPRTDDEADVLKPTIAELLRTIPETWTEYDASALTDRQGRALFLLVAAGMAERRIRFRLSIVGHPVSFEATLTATGEYGLVEAIQPIAANAWGLWADAWRQWKSGESRDVPPFICEPLKPDAWRLTDQGVLARRDLDEGNSSIVFDFVLKRGVHDGQFRLLPDGRVFQRLPVRGRGILENLTQRRGDAPAADVNIANWDDGAKAIADALGAQFVAMQAAATDEALSKAASPPKPAEGDKPAVPKRKRSTERGEAQLKLIAALTKHHQYADGGCLNPEPIGNNELARLADVSPATASAFFDEKFEGHAQYKVLCRDSARLKTSLMLLNNEFAPKHLLGDTSPAAPEQDDADLE